MYLIHFDDRSLTFSSFDELAEKGEKHIVLTGSESAKVLAGIITPLIENMTIRSVSFFTQQLSKTWKTFCSLYILMEAAGGIVLNKEQKLLMIYRNDRWDLPKGKIETGEKRDDAAIREVNEETGIGMLTIEHPSCTTYHIYPFKNKKILKCTYWFKMHSDDENTPTPQVEEGITLAVWMDKKEVNRAFKLSYLSVMTLLQAESLVDTN